MDDLWRCVAIVEAGSADEARRKLDQGHHKGAMVYNLTKLKALKAKEEDDDLKRMCRQARR